MAENFIFGGYRAAPSSNARRRALRDLFLREGTSGAPVRHWLQGVNRVAQGLLGGAMAGEAREKDEAEMQALLGAAAPASAAGARQDGLTERAAGAPPAAMEPGTAAGVAFFNSRGWTPLQSAALAGTIVSESRGNPAARNPGDGRDGSDSIGTMQWNGSRAVALRQFAASRGQDWRDRQTQLAFADAELRGQVAGSNESRWGDRLAHADDPLSAARAAISYVRPRGWTAANPDAGLHFDRRLAATRSIYDRYGGASAQAPPPASQATSAADMAGGGGSAALAPRLPELPRGGARDLPMSPMPHAATPHAATPAGARDMRDMAQADPTAAAAATAPLEAPVPMARPAERPDTQISHGVPNGTPPAVPRAADRVLGLSDRDRLMLLRDEASLAPGEADRLRALAAAMTADGPLAGTPATAPDVAPATAGGRVRDAVAHLAPPRLPEAGDTIRSPSGNLPVVDARRESIIRALLSATLQR